MHGLEIAYHAIDRVGPIDRRTIYADFRQHPSRGRLAPMGRCDGDARNAMASLLAERQASRAMDVKQRMAAGAPERLAARYDVERPKPFVQSPECTDGTRRRVTVSQTPPDTLIREQLLRRCTEAFQFFVCKNK